MIDSFRNTTLLWLSDTLGTEAHILEIIAQAVNNILAEYSPEYGLGEQIWTHVHLWFAINLRKLQFCFLASSLVDEIKMLKRNAYIDVSYC